MIRITQREMKTSFNRSSHWSYQTYCFIEINVWSPPTPLWVIYGDKLCDDPQVEGSTDSLVSGFKEHELESNNPQTSSLCLPRGGCPGCGGAISQSCDPGLGSLCSCVAFMSAELSAVWLLCRSPLCLHLCDVITDSPRRGTAAGKQMKTQFLPAC